MKKRRWKTSEVCIVGILLLVLGGIFYGGVWAFFWLRGPPYPFNEHTLDQEGLSRLLHVSEQFVQSRSKSRSENVDRSDWPAEVAALKPQFVMIVRDDSTLVLDIQLSGGFMHQGLLMVCDPEALDFVPSKSNWRIKKLGQRIFLYQE